MLTQAARRGLCAPVNLTWEITMRCNLRCRHCLADAGRARPDELSTGQCLAVIDELARLEVFQINVGGGEPFLRPDFMRILEHALDRGLVACVSTNATTLDEDLCRRLAGLEGLFLQVSLDGVDRVTNDAIRGPGTYDRILAGMNRLAESGVSFSVNTVLTRLSYPQLDGLKALASRLGAGLRVSRFRPSGRAKQSWRDLAPSPVQLESFAGWLAADGAVLTGDSFFSLTSERRRRMGLDMCGAAKMTCCLSPTGEVYPCAFLQEPEFRAGNIRSDGLEPLWLDSPVMNYFRHLEVRSCHWCQRFDSCRGGCPAMAYHTHQDPSQPDPECLMHCLGTDRPAARGQRHGLARAAVRD